MFMKIRVYCTHRERWISWLAYEITWQLCMKYAMNSVLRDSHCLKILKGHKWQYVFYLNYFLVYELMIYQTLSYCKKTFVFFSIRLFIDWKSGRDTYFFYYNFTVSPPHKITNLKWDIRFSWWCVLRLQSSGIWCNVAGRYPWIQ
jgi:hypothetical protein